MNDETYTPCTKCGRPLSYCKGQCCGKAKGCDCQEYGPKVCGAIRPGEPKCPYQAVIPSLTVESVSNLKDLADCFVHVSDINTTFYIDDKHRIMTVWAGPVEVDDYDYETNPLGLRSQYVIDRQSGRMVYYNATGDYSVMPLTDPEEQVTKSYVDEQDAATLQAAKDYTDEHGGTGDVTKAYVDAQDAATLQAAKDYTDQHGGTGDVTKAYVDQQDTATLQSAKNYADQQDVATLNSANLAAKAAIASANIPVITVQSSDPGEGTTLAANNFIAVYMENS